MEDFEQEDGKNHNSFALWAIFSALMAILVALYIINGTLKRYIAIHIILLPQRTICLILRTLWKGNMKIKLLSNTYKTKIVIACGVLIMTIGAIVFSQYLLLNKSTSVKKESNVKG